MACALAPAHSRRCRGLNPPGAALATSFFLLATYCLLRTTYFLTIQELDADALDSIRRHILC